MLDVDCVASTLQGAAVFLTSKELANNPPSSPTIRGISTLSLFYSALWNVVFFVAAVAEVSWSW